MKFITEEDLRTLYKKEPFTTYELTPELRLTPGARQFLADRGVSIFNNNFNMIKKAEENSKKNWKIMKLQRIMKSNEALFLVTEEEILSRDVILAQEVSKLGKEFSNLLDTVNKKTIPKELDCQECEGIKKDTIYDDLDDCFTITEFHMQLEKGRDIIILHRLRCALREIEPVLLELYEDCNEESELYKHTISQINQIINQLSQMICIAVGGKECQRKS